MKNELFAALSFLKAIFSPREPRCLRNCLCIFLSVTGFFV